MDIIGSKNFWFGLIIGLYMMAGAVSMSEHSVKEIRQARLNGSDSTAVVIPDSTKVVDDDPYNFKRDAKGFYGNNETFEELKERTFK